MNRRFKSGSDETGRPIKLSHSRTPNVPLPPPLPEALVTERNLSVVAKLTELYFAVKAVNMRTGRGIDCQRWLIVKVRDRDRRAEIWLTTSGNAAVQELASVQMCIEMIAAKLEDRKVNFSEPDDSHAIDDDETQTDEDTQDMLLFE